MTATNWSTVAVVVFLAWLGLAGVVGVVIGKVISDGDADCPDCGVWDDDAEWRRLEDEADIADARRDYGEGNG